MSRDSDKPECGTPRTEAVAQEVRRSLSESPQSNERLRIGMQRYYELARELERELAIIVEGRGSDEQAPEHYSEVGKRNWRIGQLLGKLDRATLSADAQPMRSLAAKCRPAVAHYMRTQERAAMSAALSTGAKETAEKEAAWLGKLLDEIDALIGPYEPPMVYDPQQGRMVAPGASARSTERASLPADLTDKEFVDLLICKPYDAWGSMDFVRLQNIAVCATSGEQSGDVRKSETPQGGVGTQMPRDGSTPSAALSNAGEFEAHDDLLDEVARRIEDLARREFQHQQHTRTDRAMEECARLVRGLKSSLSSSTGANR